MTPPAAQVRTPAAPASAPRQRAADRPLTGDGAAGERAAANPIAVLRRTAGNQAVAGIVARAAAPVADAGQPPAPDAGMATPEAKAPVATPAWATAAFKLTLAAVVLAESAAGQEDDIRWIYLQRVTRAGGEAGLKGSAAYRGNGIWYRIWRHILGDTTHGGDALPARDEFTAFAGQTIADFCTKNGWIRTVATPRAQRMVTLVDELFTAPGKNPYPGWEGQGNLNDFNNVSNTDPYWTRARAYYWLQEQGKVDKVYVKVLTAGANTQVLFDARSIATYWSTHKLPADVPKYKP